MSLLAVFAAALAVRYAFLLEFRDESYLGNIRVSDADTYFQLAKQIGAGNTPFEPYWQAPLYALLLTLFHSVFGTSLHAAQCLHTLVGALNCALLFRLTHALFGTRAAWAAAGISVFYAPFWIFDVQPLPANLTVLLYLSVTSLYLGFRKRGSWDALASAGVLLGLVIATHGLAVFTLPVFLYDIATRRRDLDLHQTSSAALIAVFLAATAIAPSAVSLRNSLVAKTPVFVSYNGGINLYVGNHRDLEQTLALRGGYEWWELFRSPYASGATKPADVNRYFLERTLDEVSQAPAAVARSFGQKFLMAFAGSEQKRNFPIYPLREDSWWLSVFLFEVHAFGIVLFAFPAGLIVPIALLGFVAARPPKESQSGGISSRTLPGWVALFHILGMLVFFPTARYRIPALMLLLPYAGFALVTAWDLAAARAPGLASSRVQTAAGALSTLVLLALVNPLASNVFRHPVKERAEHLYLSARWDQEVLQHAKSESLEAHMIATATEAIRVDPTYPEPLELLAAHFLAKDIDRSLAYLDQLDQLVPNDEDVRDKLAKVRQIRDERKRESQTGPLDSSPLRETVPR